MRGVSEVISSIPTFSGVPFFCLDEMHLIGGGVAHLVFRFFDYSTRSNYLGTKGPTEYSFRLDALLQPRKGMETLHDLIKKCASKVPKSFEGSFKAKFSFYRAVDWQNFLLVVIPNIMLRHIIQREAKDALMNLAKGYNLALRRELTGRDLNRIKW